MSRNSGSYEVKFRPAGRLNWGGCKCKENQRKAAGLTVLSGYRLEAFQRPVQPSDRTKEPEPLRPAKRSVLVRLSPYTRPPVWVAPWG